MSFFIAEAAAQTGSAPAAGNPMSTVIMMVGLFAVMYFVLIRPQRKRQKEHQALISNIGKGDEVVMTSGMLGKVIEVGELYVTVDVGSDTQLKFQKAAVHAVLPKGTIKSI